MAYTTIDDPTLFFNTVTYSGNGSARTITGVGFDPDWVWIKNRSGDFSHFLGDIIRGSNKNLNSNATAEEEDNSAKFQSVTTDGFQIGTHNGANKSGDSIVAWNWKAGGSGSSNSNGSITSTVSANTTAGFSIVSYTGTGSAATVGHGLGSAPQIVITKRRDSTGQWAMYNSNLGANKNLHLEVTDAEASSSAVWNDTESTSSVFSVGTATMTNHSGGTFIGYCFAEKKGYSKFGSYVANGNSDNTFVYTGFKVAFLMTKLTSHSGGGWEIVDNKRDGYNGENNRLYPNDSAAEGTGNDYDLLSNGFKVRQSGGSQQSGRTNIYMAFAESPFVNSNGVPNNAK
jgi:hypothetical protein